MNNTLRAVLSCGLLLLAVALQAQQPTPAPSLPYTAPDYREVLAGTAPLRVLVVSKKTMLAWKGDAEVRFINLADKSVLYTAPVGEQVGLVRVPETQGYSLRKTGQNFCPAPGAIRVESSKPLKLWTPNPENWTAYPSALVITPTADGAFSVAREMPLEEYLRNVVPAEMPATFHPQALRAQAVIARTYTLTKLGRHADEGADLCATVHCQAFSPETKRSKVTDEAVESTRGVVLLFGEKLADTYYHSSCGGVTDDAGYVWGPEYERPYLTGAVDCPAKKNEPNADAQAVLARKDAFCGQASNARWTKQFTPAEVNALVGRNLSKVTGDATAKISTVTGMTVEERTPNGRVALLRVEGDGASVLVYGDKVRWLFGSGEPDGDGLWSTLFELAVARDAAGKITGYTLTGAGRGHGLGLCQWGADGRAKAGQSFRDILRAYYPGTRLSDEKK